MAEHAEPVPLLEHWKEAEPLRLYLYGITVPLLGVALTYGWVTTEQMGAWLAVAAALFIGSSVAGELARRQVTSPATMETALEDQHRNSYSRGVEDALHRTPDAVAVARTAELQAQKSRPRPRCRFITSGRRCVLNEHGEETLHYYG